MLLYNIRLQFEIGRNGLRFYRTSCPDPGINCGGWGTFVVQVSVKDR
jgi:hypothetical protein